MIAQAAESEPPRASRRGRAASGALGCAAYRASTPGLIKREYWRGDKYRAVRARRDAHQQGEGEVTEGRFPEDQERRYGDQGEDGGVYGAPHHLADGAIDRLVEAAPVVADGRRVLPDTVEDDYGVVDGVAEHGQDGDHGYEADLPAHDGVETNRHQDVVHERRHGREGEGELEAEADKDHDDEQRGHHGLEGLVSELLAERRANGRDADLPARGFAEGVLDPGLLFLTTYDRGPYLVAVLAQRRDDGVCGQFARKCGAYLLVADLALGVGHGEL